MSSTSSSSTELILNRVSMALLIGAGIFFIYEGGLLVEMHRDAPEKIPPKVAVAGSLTIFLGIISLAFAVIHLILDGTLTGFMQQVRQGVKNASNTKPNAPNASAR